MAQRTQISGDLLSALKMLLGVASLAASLALVGCTTMEQPLPSTDPSPVTSLNPSNYDIVLRDNQRALAERKGAADIALFNIGMVSAHSLNPNKNYTKALTSFKTLVKDYPQSSRVEQAKVWIEALEQLQKNAEEKQMLAEEKQTLAEEKRSLSREREKLAQERDKLNYSLEKSRKLDAEIEKRRRQSLGR
jgi:hypothetical protein